MEKCWAYAKYLKYKHYNKLGWILLKNGQIKLYKNELTVILFLSQICVFLRSVEWQAMNGDGSNNFDQRCETELLKLLFGNSQRFLPNASYVLFIEHNGLRECTFVGATFPLLVFLIFNAHVRFRTTGANRVSSQIQHNFCLAIPIRIEHKRLGTWSKGNTHHGTTVNRTLQLSILQNANQPKAMFAQCDREISHPVNIACASQINLKRHVPERTSRFRCWLVFGLNGKKRRFWRIRFDCRCCWLLMNGRWWKWTAEWFDSDGTRCVVLRSCFLLLVAHGHSVWWIEVGRCGWLFVIDFGAGGV